MDLYIGLMSGTSIDSIDAALVDLSDEYSPRLIHAHSHPIPFQIRDEIESLSKEGSNEIYRFGLLDRKIGHLFAEAASSLIKNSGIDAKNITAIGSHGQTIRHHPEATLPFTIQIGDPNTIAFLTGITTVADFRRMDVAAGGQGAPLVPAFHDLALRDPKENRVIVNIGGMANISVLSKQHQLIGFDTGPGNILMDSWIQLKLSQPFDRAGQWAASGNSDHELLSQLLSHPYLELPPPKSTGREMFNLSWVESLLEDKPSLKEQDVQRTLLEFTAISICASINSLPTPIDRVFLCGGGANNTFLFRRIAEQLDIIPVQSTNDAGIHVDWMEAMAFAWLAKHRIESKPINFRSVTGASSECILGAVFQPVI